MFTPKNFVKFVLVLLLASGTTQIPIIGDIPRMLGAQGFGDVVGFAISVIFWWFVVGQIFDFLVFALGGGVGRYNTTKLYRRTQWIVSESLFCIPLLIALPFVLSATPLAGQSYAYKARVTAVERERRAAALSDKQSQIAAAQLRRIQRWQSAINDRQRNIDRAKTLKAETLAQTLATIDVQQAIALKPYVEIRNRSEAEFAKLETAFNSQSNAPSRMKDADRYARSIAIGKGLEDHDAVGFFAGLSYRAYRYYRLSEASYCGANDGVFKDTCAVFKDIEELSQAGDHYNRPHYPAFFALKQIAQQIKRLRALENRAEQARAQFDSVGKSYLQATKQVIADEPDFDESAYPPIDIADFPPVREADFPLNTDTSPINVKADTYQEAFQPTVEKFHLWFFPMAVVAWLMLRGLLKPLIAGLYRRIMRFLDEGRFGFGGSARFATMFEEWGNPYKAGRLYMGRSLYNPLEEIGLGGEAHMLTVAGSRGGKGTTAIIPNLLLWNGSAVVIDPKGTNAHVTAEARRKMGHDVHIIDPFGIVTDDSARFDPFEGLDLGDKVLRERITSITDALVIPDENTRDKHWDDGARTIISGLIAHVLTQGGGTKSLHDVRDLIRQLPEEQDRLWAEMAYNEGGGGYAKDAAMRYIRGSQTNEILGIMSNADKHTEWLSSPAMRHVTSDPTFSLRDIKQKPTTIYLVIPPRQLERQSRLLRLFVNLVIDAMEDGGRSKIPVLMIMDEFLALGKMPEIATAFATMASYNLTLWPFVQDLGRMQELYGASFNAFVANSRAIQVFAVSDQKTKKFVSETFGSRPISGLGSISKSNDNLPLRAENDIETDVSAAEGRQYVIETGKAAMIIEKVPYYKSKPVWWSLGRGRFHGKYNPDPDFAE